MLEAAYRAGASAISIPRRPVPTIRTCNKTREVRALKESDAYPAMAERGMAGRSCCRRCSARNTGTRGMKSAIARFHNVYGPYGTWDGGREKAPAAICRKVIEAKDTGHTDRDLGRRQPDPELHVHRRLYPGHRHDHALRRLIATPINLGSASWSRSISWRAGRRDRRCPAATRLQPRCTQGRRWP